MRGPGWGTFVVGKLPRTDTETQAPLPGLAERVDALPRGPPDSDFDDIEAIYHAPVGTASRRRWA